MGRAGFHASRAAYEGRSAKYPRHGRRRQKMPPAGGRHGTEFITDSPFYLYEGGAEPYRELSTRRTPRPARWCSAAATTKPSASRTRCPTTSSSAAREPHAPLHEPLPHGRRLALHRQGGAGRRCHYSEETRGRDPRMAQTVLCPGYKQVEATTVTRNTLSSHTGYEPIKVRRHGRQLDHVGCREQRLDPDACRRSLPQLRRGGGRNWERSRRTTSKSRST